MTEVTDERITRDPALVSVPTQDAMGEYLLLVAMYVRVNRRRSRRVRRYYELSRVGPCTRINKSNSN